MEWEKFLFDLQLFGDDENNSGDENGGDENNDSPIVIGKTYQLKWDTATAETPVYGLFEVSPKKSTAEDATTYDCGKFTIAAQSAAMTLKAPTSGTKYYVAVKNTPYKNDDESITCPNGLDIEGLFSVDSAGTVTKLYPADNVLAKATVTLTAPSTALAFAAAEATGMTITINNLAAGSNIGLKAGDKAVTAKLDKGDVIHTGDTSSFTSNGGVLTLVGETVEEEVTDSETQETTTTTEHNTVLYAGDIIVKQADSSVHLAGTATGKEDDISVKVDKDATSAIDDDGVVVKAASGKITSITDLEGKGATVEVVVNSSQKVGNLSIPIVTTTVYKVLDDEDKMIEKTVTSQVNGVQDGEPTVTYLDLTKGGGEIYSGNYKAASVTNVIGSWGDGKKATTNDVFYHLSVSSADADTDSIVTSDNAATTFGRAVKDGKFQANAGDYYLKVKSSTTKQVTDKDDNVTTPATTTISSFEVYKGNAAGALVKVTTEAYTGTLKQDASGQIIKYTKPTTGQFANAHVNITDADIRSTFTNLKLGTNADSVTTKAATYTDLATGTYKIYSGTSVDATVAISGKVNVTVEESSNTLGDITGLNNGEKVTITHADGSIEVYTGTTPVSVKDPDTGKTTKYDTLTIETTSNTGAYHKYTGVRVDTDTLKTLNLNGGVNEESGYPTVFEEAITTGIADKTATETQSIVTDFDWTLNKSHVGYFAATTTATIPKSGKTSITATKDARYVKVTLDEDDPTKAAVSVVKVSNAGESTTAFEDKDKFAGALTITAPDKEGMTISLDGTNINAEKATAKITNLTKGSTVDVSVFEGTKSAMVTTAKLANGDQVTVNDDIYSASGNNATLSINDGGLYSGTVWAYHNVTPSVKVGKYTIANSIGSNLDAGEDIEKYAITVTATNGTSFSVGSLNDGDTFTVTDTDNKLGGAFTRYGNYLYETTDASNPKMYALKTGTSIASANLNTSASTWQKGYDTKDNAFVTSTVKLSLADKDLAADTTASRTFIRDRYMTTDPTKATNVNATVGTANAAYTVTEGTAYGKTNETNAPKAGYSNKYVAATAQTIEVANGWEVAAAAAGSTIKGATSGKDYLTANTGTDKITLNGAEDVVDVGTNFGGKDEITGYASGKDKLIVDDNAAFVLSTTTANDVYVAAAGTTAIADDTEYVLLKGVGGKAVTINDKVHYFGNGKEDTKGKTAAGTFIYEDGAYYQGNNSGNNTLKVNTIKGKAAKGVEGDAVAVSLVAPETGTAHYVNIETVDASASANEVELTAAAARTAATATSAGDGYTLKGGTYKSTLTGGTGNDTLWGGTGEDTFVLSLVDGGHDTVKNYTSDKDKLSVTTENDAALTATSFTVDGKNVLIGYTGTTENPDLQYVTVENAVGKKLTVNDTDVFVGVQTTGNTFTTKNGAGIYVGSEKYKDTIKVVKSVEGLTETALDDDKKAGLGLGADDEVYVYSKYQGGKIDLSNSTAGSNYAGIDVVDASGVKATAAAVSEYGTKFLKAHAGVDVTAAAGAGTDNVGTTFTGSAFNDRFTCGTGNDTINYSTNQGSDIIKDFGVGDIIQLNGLSSADIAALNNLNSGAQSEGTFTFTSGGSLAISAAENAEMKLTYDAAKKQIKGVANPQT